MEIADFFEILATFCQIIQHPSEQNNLHINCNVNLICTVLICLKYFLYLSCLFIFFLSLLWPLWKKKVNYKCLMKREYSRNYLDLRRMNYIGNLWCCMTRNFAIYVLWHVDLLLGNDREISNYTSAVAKQWLCKQTWMQQLHCNRGMVFSTRSMPRSYEQDKLGSEWVSE
jgi:hypothetical protein